MIEESASSMLMCKPILFTRWSPISSGLPSLVSKRLAPLAIKMDVPEDAIDALLSLSGIKRPKQEYMINQPVLQKFITNIIVNQNAAYKDSKKQCRVHICRADDCNKIFPSISRLTRHEKTHKTLTAKRECLIPKCF